MTDKQNKETTVPDIRYPATRRTDVLETKFGHRIDDPYRWLEADPAKDPEVAAWIAAENAVTEAYLATLPGRDRFRERLNALFNVEQLALPTERGGRYFSIRLPEQGGQPKLIVREGGQDRVLIDPDLWSGDQADALGEWAPSDDGRLVAYGVQVGGSDWRTLRIINVESGETLEDELHWARTTQIVWSADGSAFFYSRYPEPAGGMSDSAALTGHAVYLHILGMPQAQDRLIHSDPERPTDLHIAARTSDGRFLILYSTAGVGVNALSVVDLRSTAFQPRSLYAEQDANWTLIGSEGDRLLLLTDKDAERGRIVSLDLAEAEPVPVEIVGEADAVLTDAALVGDRLLARYLVDAHTQVKRFTTSGAEDGALRLLGLGSAGGFESRHDRKEAFYIFTSYDTPITVYRYDVEADVSDVWAKPDIPFDPEDFVVEQKFYASKDGTRVPLSFIRHKTVSGPAPTVLYGYGGFGLSMVPVYNPANMAWVDQGGVLAIANIRGGGEYGRAWHAAGQFEKRQNAFDDFIAAGEFLKAQGIATNDGLVIQGESNGGLLVGVVVNQRPDLFAAALPGVGPMDMLRYHRFSGGTLWISDFGSPDEEGSFKNLLSYSPYHNIAEGGGYPAVLATTAEADSRVVPGHTFKYMAALQATDLGPRPRLVRIETRAGHGAGMSRDKTVVLYADMWAFAAYWSGLSADAPRPAPDCRATGRSPTADCE